MLCAYHVIAVSMPCRVPYSMHVLLATGVLLSYSAPQSMLIESSECPQPEITQKSSLKLATCCSKHSKPSLIKFCTAICGVPRHFTW